MACARYVCVFFALVFLSMINVTPGMSIVEILLLDADPSTVLCISDETELNITSPTTTPPPIIDASVDSSANQTDSQLTIAFVGTGNTENSTEEIPLKNPAYQKKGEKGGLEPWQYVLTFGGMALLSMLVILILTVCFRRSQGSKSISDEVVRPESSKKKEKEGKRLSLPPPESSKIQNRAPVPIYIAQKSPTKVKSQREKSREDKSTREALRSAKEAGSTVKKSSRPPPQLSKIQDRAPIPIPTSIYDAQKLQRKKSAKETLTKDALKSAKVVGLADIKSSKERRQSARESLVVADALKTPRAPSKVFLSKLPSKHRRMPQFAKENSLTERWSSTGSTTTASTTTGSSSLSALSPSSTRSFSSVKETKKFSGPFSREISPSPSKGSFREPRYFRSSLVSANECLAKSSKSAKR